MQIQGYAVCYDTALQAKHLTAHMMNSERPLLLIVLVIYIFSPTLFSWVVNPNGAWYRPYLIWLLVVVIAYVLQGRKKKNDI